MNSTSTTSSPPLETVLCTDELNCRPSRPADYERENRALESLVQALVDSPSNILQSLADTVLMLFQCDSVGVSLLTEDKKRFYWPAIAGVWKPHIGGGTPRDFGPCGDVLDRNRPLMFKRPERRYTYLQPAMPPAEECLLVPFYVEGIAVGTIWTIIHDDQVGTRRFDSEDLRMLLSLATFASAAYQAVEQLHSLSEQIRERQEAQQALRDGNEALLVSSIRQHELTDRARESEARYRVLFEAAPMAVFVCDIKAVIQQYNARAAELWGREPICGVEKHCGSTKLWLLDGTLLPHSQSPIVAVLRTGVPARNVEVYIERPDGSRLPVLVNFAALKNAQGAIIGAITSFVDITDRKDAEEALRAAHDQLEQRICERTEELIGANRALRDEIKERTQAERSRQQLLHKLVTAQEEERRRIARELHDQMGQLLTGLILGLKSIEHSGVGEVNIERLRSLQEVANQIGREIHELALELRPTALDDLGLHAVLTNYLETWSDQTGIPVDFHSRGLEGARLPPSTETAFYRVTQEALTNVLKHAQANRISVVLELDKGAILLIIEDDGLGFDIEQIRETSQAMQRLGLLGMQERVAAVNGEFQIESAIGQGTTIIARAAIES